MSRMSMSRNDVLARLSTYIYDLFDVVHAKADILDEVAVFSQVIRDFRHAWFIGTFEYDNDLETY